MAELNEFEQKCQDWLDKPAAERNVQDGALLMLQANRNRILFQNVVNKKNVDKIEYELKKYLGTKYRQCDAPTVQKMHEELVKVTETLPAETQGKREDHDKLPAEIQKLYFDNSEIYARMRSLHEKLKLMSGDGYTPCDRFPYLKELLANSAQIRENWKMYDTFVIGQKVEAKVKAPVIIDAKRVSANRKYLSDNKSKLAVLIADKNEEKAAELLSKMQIRFNELIQNGETFAPDQVEELKKLGIIVGVEETKPDAPETGIQIQDPANPEIDPAKEPEGYLPEGEKEPAREPEGDAAGADTNLPAGE